MLIPTLAFPILPIAYLHTRDYYSLRSWNGKETRLSPAWNGKASKSKQVAVHFSEIGKNFLNFSFSTCPLHQLINVKSSFKGQKKKKEAGEEPL